MMDSIGPKNDSQSESQLAALIQQASHYDYTKELKIGMYVDAKDTAQTLAHGKNIEPSTYWHYCPL